MNQQSQARGGNRLACGIVYPQIVPVGGEETPEQTAGRIREERDRYKLALEQIANGAIAPVARRLAHEALHPQSD